MASPILLHPQPSGLPATWQPPCPSAGCSSLRVLERRNGGDRQGDEWDEYYTCKERAERAAASRAVMVAARVGDCDELRRRDADIAAARDEDGATALAWAARHGQVACVRLLLERGSTVDATDDGGWTPLMDAAYANQPDAVRALLAAGADPRRENRELETALSNAREVGSSGCLELLRAALSAEELVLEAARSGDAAQLRAALAAGADLGSADLLCRRCHHHRERSTALHWASAEGHVASATALLAHGAAADAADGASGGWTALHASVCNQQVATVRLLLDAAADPQLKDSDGHTAVDCATRWPPSAAKEACAALLLEAVRRRQEQQAAAAALAPPRRRAVRRALLSLVRELRVVRVRRRSASSAARANTP